MSPNPLPSRNAQPFPKTAKTARPYIPGARMGSKRKLLTVGGVAVLLIGLGFGGVLIFGHFHRNPLLAEIDRLRAQMEANGGRPWDAQNRELFDQIRKLHDQLPPELQAELDKQRQAEMAKRMGGTDQQKGVLHAFAAFFAMSPADQEAAMDKALKQNMEWQKQMWGGGPPGGGQPATGDKSNSSSTQTTAPPPGPWGGRSDAQRLQGKQQMLQTFPPEGRADFTVWHQMMQSRATQLGLPPSAAWGPPPGMGPPH